MRTRAEQYEVSRRKTLNRKALAERLNHHTYVNEMNWYVNTDFFRYKPIKGYYKDGEVNRYSKGKIYCSCPICRIKRNGRFSKGNKDYKISDRRKADALNYIE